MLKRLKDIEGKNEQQLDLIKDQGDRQLNLIGKINAERIKLIEFYDKTKIKAKNVADKINKVIKKILNIKDRDDDKPRLAYYCSDKTADHFDRYIDLNEFGKKTQNGLISLNEAKKQQAKMLSKIDKLKNHNVKGEKRIKFKNDVLKNVKTIFNARLDIIEGSEDGVF